MKTQHSANLDILRGVAALVVVLRHLQGYADVFDRNFSFDRLFNYNFPAHLCVLVFFVLSGYVIGLNHPAMSDKDQVRDYIKKRLTRILPIYFVAILFTALVWRRSYSLFQIFCNFSLISVPMNNVFRQDDPIWSLNYELIYYFVFIAFSYWKIDLKKTVMALLAIVGAIYFASHFVKIHPLFMSYLNGFIFWIAGAMIAKLKSPVLRITHSRIISVFILIFCLQQLNPYGPILKVLHLQGPDYSSFSYFQQIISYDDLFYFPAMLLLIFSLTHSFSKYNKIFLYFTFIFLGLRFILLFYKYNMAYVISEHYVVPGLILIASMLLWLLNFQVGGGVIRAIKSTAILSRISYAMYIIHVPILFIFGWFPVSSGISFFLKIIFFLATVFAISYLLEGRFQQFVKKLLKVKQGRGLHASS